MSDRLDEIEARANAATEGPWSWDNGEEECGHPCTPNGCMGHDSGVPESLHPVGLTWTYALEEAMYATGGVAQWQDDAAFIAHAREDVPWLIARIRELEAQIANTAPHRSEDAASRPSDSGVTAPRAVDTTKANPSAEGGN